MGLKKTGGTSAKAEATRKFREFADKCKADPNFARSFLNSNGTALERKAIADYIGISKVTIYRNETILSFDKKHGELVDLERALLKQGLFSPIEFAPGQASKRQSNDQHEAARVAKMEAELVAANARILELERKLKQANIEKEILKENGGVTW